MIFVKFIVGFRILGGGSNYNIFREFCYIRKSTVNPRVLLLGPKFDKRLIVIFDVEHDVMHFTQLICGFKNLC